MLMLLLELQANLKIIGNNKADKYRVPTLGNTELWNPIFFLFMIVFFSCSMLAQPVLMKEDSLFLRQQ